MVKLKTFIKNPEYFITSPASKGWLDWLPDDIYLKILYYIKMGKKLNLKNPIGYNEKLQWIKLYDRKPEYSRLVDKYEVRGFVEDKIGKEYLVDCFGVWEDTADIPISELPEKFVLKCTHDSGSVEICNYRKKFNFKTALERLSLAMKRDYYKTYREWPYKAVQPRIIAEQYLEADKNGDLQDYKVMCFSGEALFVEFHENRFINGKEHTQTFYDRDWNMLDLRQKGIGASLIKAPKPEHLDKILSLSEQLSKNICHTRIDWYISENKIYFGEITFFDGSGFYAFETEEMERYMGSLIKLPDKKTM